jgi:spermidine/putrescine transport system ATP-binding protein
MKPMQPMEPVKGGIVDRTSEWGEPAVEFRATSKRYGDHQALLPLDLTIREGEFFCLLGPSGCGKTTTLNLLGGFVQPSGGEILLRGQRIERTPPHQRPVNTVFQSYALFPHMTVRDNIGFGLKMAKVGRAEAAARIDEVLAQVGLERFADRMPPQLSGGQQQRVAVARALVNRPAVLILDEPLGALDLKLRKRMQVELAQIHREVGTTFVYVTHDQEEAMAMADRIGVMSEGRLEQVAAPADVYLRPATRFVADFIGESNFLDVTVDPADGCARSAGGWKVPAHPAVLERIGGSGTVMIRPECVQLVADGGDAIPATVLHTSFMGSYAHVVCQVAGSDRHVAASLSSHDRLRVSQLIPGQTVGLSWEPGQAVVFDQNDNVTPEVADAPVTPHYAR